MLKGFATRLLVLTATLIAESLIVSNFPHPWFRPQQIMAAPIVFVAAFLFFGRRKLQATTIEHAPLNRPLLAVHLLSFAAVIACTLWLLRLIPPGTTPEVPILSSNFWWIALWYGAMAAMAGSLTLALFPLRQLSRTLGSLRSVWLYAAVTTAATMSARSFVRILWDAPDSSFGRALQESTFAGTRVLLNLFYPDVVADPPTHLLGTSFFNVTVAGTCSGIEGLALMLIFTVGWLVYTRRELYLKRALLLVPVALALSWFLNITRIFLLIVIGNTGRTDTALNGFHSEAGWIFFNVIAIAFLLTVQRLRWLQRSTGDAGAPHLDSEMWVAKHDRTSSHTDRTAAYLLPFLAVLATSLITHATSSGTKSSGTFEWLYPLRLVVAAAALWYFRRDYRSVDWRFSWLGPVTGAVVFLLWIGAAHLQPATAPNALAASLAHLPPPERALWLTARILAAVITVPIAEELAFRGYLARRVMSPDFDSVPLTHLGWIAIAASSVVFGLLHGGLWQVGIVAGVAFALVARRTNRLGEAVAAHATANLLLAAWVLTRGDYGLW